MKKLNLTIKQQQYCLLAAVLLGGILLGAGFFKLMEPVAPTTKTQRTKSLTTGVQRLNPQEAWVHQTGTELQRLEQRQANLEQLLQQALKVAATPRPKLSVAPPKTTAGQLREVISQGIPTSETRRSQSETPIESSKPASQQPTRLPPEIKIKAPQTATPAASQPTTLVPPTNPGIFHLQIPMPVNTEPAFRFEIQANTFAPAVLLGKVDALTGTNAPNDPDPALIRITGPGILPRSGRQDLEGCFVSARAYGKLPSERVDMRLDTFTCKDRKTGQTFSLPVKGYVSGEDGGPGLRGILVDRAGPAIRNVAIAGVLNSTAGFFTKNIQPLPGGQLNWTQAEAFLKVGAGQGVGDAFNKMAEFYIKRAERLEPVIQIQAGRLVNVVFTADASWEAGATPAMQPTVKSQGDTISPPASNPALPTTLPNPPIL